MVLDMAQRDYYDILGVSRSATPEQIKAAYRRLARKHHPDVSKSKDAGAKFKEATAAYEVLSDPEKRKMYDRFGHAGPEGFNYQRAGQRPPGAAGRYAWKYRGGEGSPFDFEDLFAASPFSGMSLDELLAALGGYSRRGSRRSRRSSGPANGFDPFASAGASQADLEYPVTLDFMQAVKGCTTALELRRPDGSSERIEVKIPAGVRDGSKVRVRGKGRIGPAGPGDLFIVTHVREHPCFRRDGADIYIDLPVSVAEAGLGAEVTVPTLDGYASVKIPPGASSGTRLRLRGKGAPDPRAGKRGQAEGARDAVPRSGDLYVVLKVVLPTKISKEGQKLLSEFSQTDPYDPRKKVPW